MTRLHEGFDYLLYRFYIWGGIAALVIYFTVIIVLYSYDVITPSDNAITIILSAPVTPWVLGILAYWWWVFLFKDNKALQESIENPPKQLPGISALKSWSTLHTAMALYGGNMDAMLKNSKEARHPVIIWYGLQNLFVLWIIGNFWVWILFKETLPTNYIMQVWVPGVFIIIFLFVIVTPFLISKTGKSGEAAYLEPLGLSITTPSKIQSISSDITDSNKSLRYEKATIFNGNRRGRPVHIEVSGKQSFTLVVTQSPPFAIHSQEGKLEANPNTPITIREALRGLRKAKRWVGISITGSSEGVSIERTSPGQNMWLYDLWLIERILDSINIKDALN